MLGTWKWRFAAALLTVASISSLFGAQPGVNLKPDEDSQTEEKILEWINQLGDPQYSNREKAQEELRRAGTAAFDLLIAAQDNTDVEIAQRARYLVRSIPVGWTLDSDSAEVKSLLTNFGELGRNERKTRAQHLAKLEGHAGIQPLCRIVRFEPDRVLSKQAALLIMVQEVAADAPDARRKLAETIRKGIEFSKRPAVGWLETYARELEQKGSTIGEWDRITQLELETFAKTPSQSDREIARDLLRWQTKLLLENGRESDALVNYRRTYELVDDAASDIYEAMDWAIEHKLLTAPDDIASRFAIRVNGDPKLLYRLAEAQMKRGDKSLADKTALAASQLNPGKPNDHLATAVVLHQRGLIDWSINEYQRVIGEVKVEATESIEARGQLAEMLFDVGREFDAAETFKPLVEFAEKDGKENEISQLIRTLYRGNMHYYYGVHFAKLGDRAKQIEHLTKAIESYPTNIDILIAMFRVPEPDANWKQDVQRRIDAHLGNCRTLISRYEDILRRQPNLEAAGGERLATAYNELAWLMSNTAGDPQEAIRASQRSLELDADNPAYLDTLGRCYFAAGDFETAIKYQRRAIKAMPHMQVMQRQLKLFEQAQKDAKSKSTAPDAQKPDTPKARDQKPAEPADQKPGDEKSAGAKPVESK